MPLVQGRKRRAQIEPDSPSASPEPATQRRRLTPEPDDDEAYGADNAATQAGDTNLDAMVKKLVRLALACEYSRRQIRRADITEKVLGSAGRQFKSVFNQAQLQLRSVFGMEMVELPAREKVTLQQRRAAQKTSQGSKAPTSWVLISILPAQYRESSILAPPAVPTAVEEGKYVAIYTLLVSLISLSGGTLPDAKMERYLRRLNMEDNAPVDGFEKTETLLKRLERDGYVFKVKEATGAGEDDVYWCVGPRGKVEVGDEGTRGLVKSVYGEMEGEEEEEELERRIARSLGLGQRVERREEQGRSGGEKKKRGRRRRDEEEGEEEDEEEEEE